MDPEAGDHPGQAARVDLALTARGGSAAAILQADAVNLSPGGLCVRTSRGDRVGQHLAIDVRCEAERFALHGVVAWSRPRASLLGIRFVHLSPEASSRLEALVWLLAALAQ